MFLRELRQGITARLEFGFKSIQPIIHCISISAPQSPPATPLERVKGIEPSSQAWEAHVLPLNHTRIFRGRVCFTNFSGAWQLRIMAWSPTRRISELCQVAFGVRRLVSLWRRADLAARPEWCARLRSASYAAASRGRAAPWSIGRRQVACPKSGENSPHSKKECFSKNQLSSPYRLG